MAAKAGQRKSLRGAGGERKARDQGGKVNKEKLGRGNCTPVEISCEQPLNGREGATGDAGRRGAATRLEEIKLADI